MHISVRARFGGFGFSAAFFSGLSRRATATTVASRPDEHRLGGEDSNPGLRVQSATAYH